MLHSHETWGVFVNLKAIHRIVVAQIWIIASWLLNLLFSCMHTNNCCVKGIISYKQNRPMNETNRATGDVLNSTTFRCTRCTWGAFGHVELALIILGWKACLRPFSLISTKSSIFSFSLSACPSDTYDISTIKYFIACMSVLSTRGSWEGAFLSFLFLSLVLFKYARMFT